MYTTPETTCLTINAQTMICTSPGPEPAPYRAQIGTMTHTTGEWK